MCACVVIPWDLVCADPVGSCVRCVFSAMRLAYKQPSFSRYAYAGEDQCLSSPPLQHPPAKPSPTVPRRSTPSPDHYCLPAYCISGPSRQPYPHDHDGASLLADLNFRLSPAFYPAPSPTTSSFLPCLQHPFPRSRHLRPPGAQLHRSIITAFRHTALVVRLGSLITAITMARASWRT